MKIVRDDVGDHFDREMSQGYRTTEDTTDAAGAAPGHSNYPVVEQLRGESRKRWIREFGYC